MRLPNLMKRQEGTSILRHIVIIGLVCVVIGLLIAEIGPIIWNRFSIISDAETVGSAAAREYRIRHGVPAVREQEVLEYAAGQLREMGYSQEEIGKSSVVFTPGPPEAPTKVTVTLVKIAKTLVTSHVGFLKKLATVTRSYEASIGQQ